MGRRKNIQKIDNLNFLWGKLKDIKKPTDKIIEELDEGEDYKNEI